MKNRKRRSEGEFACPHCGAPVRADARFCRQCGASEDSGWNEDDSLEEDVAGYAGADDFNYDEFIAREFPDHADRPHGRGSRWWIVGLVLLAFLMYLFARGW